MMHREKMRLDSPNQLLFKKQTIGRHEITNDKRFRSSSYASYDNHARHSTRSFTYKNMLLMCISLES